MEYHAANQKVFLLGKGHMWQNGDEFTGNRIEYDINKDLVIAKSTTVNVGDKKVSPTERVHVVIQPQQNRNKPVAKPVKKSTKPAEKPQAVTEQPSTSKAQQKPAEKETPVDTTPASDATAPTAEEAPTSQEKPDNSSQAPSATSSKPLAFTLTNINVRSGPGTNFDKVAQFKINTEVSILDTQQGWHQVRGLADGKQVTGWLSARYVDDLTETTAARTLSKINVRSGPSTKFKKLAQFKENTRIAILASKDGWHQVVGNVAGKRVIGWLSARYVAISKAH
jgi:uncharacterized protein YraI